MLNARFISAKGLRHKRGIFGLPRIFLCDIVELALQ
jgi:hypothetical protein